MIIDKIENLENYVSLNNEFKKVFEFIKKWIDKKNEPGKYEINSKNSYINLDIIQTRESANWEAHQNYWDIHIVLNGAENFGWSPGKGFKEEQAYNSEKDIEFYSSEGEYLTLTPGHFIMVAPGEFHKPAMMIEEPSTITKVVVKVLSTIKNRN